MDSNLGRSNGGKRFCTSSCSVPPQRIYPRFSRASSAVRPTFIQKGARGPTLVPNRLQRVQAPAYNEPQDQPSHNKVNQPMSFAQYGQLYAPEPQPTGIGVTCQRYPYHQIELDQVWRLADVNMKSVFEGLDKINETHINDRKKVTRSLLVDETHNYLSVPVDAEKTMLIGPDFILNGAPLYNKYLEKKSQNKEWEKKMQGIHLRLRQEARDLSLHYVTGDLKRVKSTGQYKNVLEVTDANQQRSNICRLHQVYEAAYAKNIGSTHMIKDEILVKQIVALNNLELDITNATQKIMKDMALEMYQQMQDHYSFGNLHDRVVRTRSHVYSHFAKLSGKYAYCSFLLNFVLKKLTDHLDCDHALKEKVMKSAMEHRNLEFHGTCAVEKTFLPRIYLEAKRRLKQTPSMHMKKHKIILDQESATSATAYAVSALVGMERNVKVQTGDIHQGKIVRVDTDADDQSMSQSMSQSIAQSMSSSGMIARDLNRKYETIPLPKVDLKIGLLPFQQPPNKVMIPTSGVGQKTAMLERQTHQGLSEGDEPSLPTISTDKAVLQEGLSVGDSTSLGTKSQQKIIIQEKTVRPASADNLNSENNGYKFRQSPSDSTVTEDVTHIPKQTTIAYQPYKSNRTSEDIFCHREDCRRHSESQMMPIEKHAGKSLKGTYKKYHVNSSPCGFGYRECVFNKVDLVVSEENTKDVLVQDELKSIEEMLEKDLQSELKDVEASVKDGTMLEEEAPKKIQQLTEKSRLNVEHEKRNYIDRVKDKNLLGQLNDGKIMKKYKCKFKAFVFMCDSCLREDSSNPVCCCKFCFDAAQSKYDKRYRKGSPTEKRTRSNTKRNLSATTSTRAIKKKQRDNRTKTSQS